MVHDTVLYPCVLPRLRNESSSNLTDGICGLVPPGGTRNLRVPSGRRRDWEDGQGDGPCRRGRKMVWRVGRKFETESKVGYRIYRVRSSSEGLKDCVFTSVRRGIKV